MIALTVLSYNGAPADGLSATFDELGGSIGRADNNQLVLPDPERTISRVHARIVFRNGGYTIVDNGSNPISVNGAALGSGREQSLNAGDRVQIGGYVLQVAAGQPSVSSDPFADLFGDASAGLAAAPVAAPPARSAIASWPTPAPPPPPAAGTAQIPADWDPFAPDPAPAGAPFGAAPALPAQPASGALGMALDPASAGSLDDLFDLGSAPAAADPLGAAPQQALLLQPNTAGHADPLQALSYPPVPVAPRSVPDHGSELNAPMPLAPVVSARAPAAPGPASPAGAVFSWDEPSRDGRVVTLPGVRRGKEPAQPPAAAPAAPQPAPAAAALPPAPAAGDDALLAALLNGLATPALRIEALTPALMELIGQLLRESMRGAVELLVARAALKREMRADVTMIVAQENNPLKFSPSVEVALQHLLGAQAPGFMAPAPAVRDAFDDLRAHQLGVMAGMKAALDGVLQRFDPQLLESKLTRKSALSTLLPSGRKAQLWELFQELFGQLSSEAQDDFDELFGKAFLRAYQSQLDRLHGEPGPR